MKTQVQKKRKEKKNEEMKKIEEEWQFVTNISEFVDIVSVGEHQSDTKLLAETLEHESSAAGAINCCRVARLPLQHTHFTFTSVRPTPCCSLNAVIVV